ncbi:hypothetical protein [Mycobacterium sp.]|uniref:hypothetical protein n=1 Tax=Mycobacterium sp. TaxID=1785 RepID=UPI003C78D26E
MSSRANSRRCDLSYIDTTKTRSDIVRVISTGFVVSRDPLPVKQGDHRTTPRQGYDATVLYLTLIGGAVRRERALPKDCLQQDPRLDQGELGAEAMVRAASERYPMASVGPVAHEPFRIECPSVGIQVGSLLGWYVNRGDHRRRSHPAESGYLVAVRI